MRDSENERTVRKLELHAQDGRLLGIADIKLRPAAKQRRRVSA